MNEAVEAYIAELGPPDVAAAEISGDLHADKPWREYPASPGPSSTSARR